MSDGEQKQIQLEACYEHLRQLDQDERRIIDVFRRNLPLREATFFQVIAQHCRVLVRIDDARSEVEREISDLLYPSQGAPGGA